MVSKVALIGAFLFLSLLHCAVSTADLIPEQIHVSLGGNFVPNLASIYSLVPSWELLVHLLLLLLLGSLMELLGTHSNSEFVGTVDNMDDILESHPTGAESGVRARGRGRRRPISEHFRWIERTVLERQPTGMDASRLCP